MVAPGTLLQSGELFDVQVSKTVFARGERIPVSGKFVNSGESPLRGIFSIEVLHDGEYEDLVIGEEFVIGIAETAEVFLMIEPKDIGTYTLNSYVKFANRKSNVVKISTDISGGSGPIAFLNSPIGIGVLSGIILLFVIGVIVRRRSHHALMAQSPSISVPAISTPVIPVPQQPASSSSTSSSPPQSDQPRRRW